MTYYKVLGEQGRACNGGKGLWLLPHDGQPGDWMPQISMIVPCESGYHLCRRNDLILWLGPIIYEAEGRGEMLETEDKVVFGEARLLRRLDTWNERSARLFACDVAEHVLRLFEALSPTDQRSLEAIRIVRLFAEGRATKEEVDAAWDAAWDAAVAAWAAEDVGVAGTAAGAALTAWAGGDAGDAAGAAAGTVAWTAGAAEAVGAVAWAAERQWQIERLFEYLEAKR